MAAPMRRTVPPSLVAVAAGVLLAAALPPFGWWPLALVGVALLDRVLAGRAARGRAAVGAAAGIGFLGPGLWWMTEFHAVGWIFALAIEVALFTTAALLTPPGRGRWLALPGALVVAELLRGVVPFGGVPIATLAQTQIGGPLMPLAAVGGSALVAGATAAAGVALAAAARRAWRPAAVGAGLAAVALVAAALAPGPEADGELRVALVQGGGPRGTRAVDTDEGVVFTRHLDASAGVEAPVDLVLWPEDVVDVEGDVLGRPEGDALADLARRLDATVVAGVVEGAGDRFRNASIAWAPDGRPVARYDKRQRVPFGEYVPLRSVIEQVVDLSVIPRDAEAGEGPGILRTPAGDLGVLISYEVFFARRADAAVEAGGRLLLVPTNASSYSTTQMPALTLAAARMRAVETGRAVAQAAPTGFTAVIDPDGTVRQHTDLGAADVLHATVPLRRGRTPYTAGGDVPWLVLAAGAVAAGWAVAARARSAGRRATGGAGDGAGPADDAAAPAAAG
jgi:apolipoprotein N-acyltransferase